MPYKAVATGDVKLELRGLPGQKTIKDPSEMGEATLSKIIECADRIQLVVLNDRARVENDVRRAHDDNAEDISTVANDELGTGEVDQDAVGTRDVARMSEGDSDVTGKGDHVAGMNEVENNVARRTEIEEAGTSELRNENDAGLVSEEMSQEDCAAAGRQKRNTNKRKKSRNDKEKSKKKKKKSDVYKCCSAFLCHEPSVDETGFVHWVRCDKCNDWFHLDCVGLLKNPAKNFFCGCDRILFSQRYIPL